MITRKAHLGDIPGVLALQDRYLVIHIPIELRANGFVTTPFTTQQIEDAIAIDGLFVAEDDQGIVAYVFAGSWDYFAHWPIFPFMTARFPQVFFEGKALEIATSFQYGPICIDERYRGTGLLQRIYNTMLDGMQPRFPIGVTFINKINQRSVRAHTLKLGMTIVDEFSFNQNEYLGLAFRTDRRIL